METSILGLYWAYIGIMEKKMETIGAELHSTL